MVDNMHDKSPLKGQLSTEYLVLVAVVIVVALLVVYIFGEFLGLGGSYSSHDSRAYWRTSLIGMSNWRVYSNGSGDFSIKNNHEYNIELNDVYVNGNMIINNAGIILRPGGTKVIRGEVGAGTGTYHLDFRFSYDIIIK